LSGGFSSRTFHTSDGVRLNVLQAGAGAGPIAFVPGWCMPARLWCGSMALLAGRFRLAALDPRGQGDSDLPVHGYTIERRAEDIAEFVSWLRPKVLVAWSLGALEALQFLHCRGEPAIRGLVIVDSSVGEPPASPGGAEWRGALQTDRPAAIESFVRALFRTPRPEEEVAALCRQALRLPLGASLSLFPSHLPREHWRALVEGFSRPLLYAVTPQFEDQAMELVRRRPGTQIEIFRGAGHALFVDEPERFARLLADFCSALP